jgi:alkylation response protein AidB-like acyl-CoA dehydrogenase
MDYYFTPQQEKLKEEFAAFFREAMKEAPPGWRPGGEHPFTSDENWAFHRKVARKLAEKGGLSRTWPAEYGGRSAPVIEFVLMNEVAGYYYAPGIDIFAINMIGTALLSMGTEEQKKYHLPRMANAEVMWCQGWSEPDSGSDLSSLTTQAVREGDYYIVNGQKIWTSNAHRADWMFLLVRTSPKREKGLTVLLVDMKTPGITVNPVEAMNGDHHFNEVFFDNVKVPVENRLGEENKGWEVTKAIMNQERMGMAHDIGSAQRELEELIEFAKTTFVHGKPLIENPIYRRQLAERTVELEIARSLCYRLVWLVEHGTDIEIAMPYASALKLFVTDKHRQFAENAFEMMGLCAQVKEGCEWAPMRGTYEYEYQTRLGLNIAGGTTEVQKNIIAWKGLKLPRK